MVVMEMVKPSWWRPILKGYVEEKRVATQLVYLKWQSRNNSTQLNSVGSQGTLKGKEPVLVSPIFGVCEVSAVGKFF